MTATTTTCSFLPENVGILVCGEKKGIYLSEESKANIGNAAVIISGKTDKVAILISPTSNCLFTSAYIVDVAKEVTNIETIVNSLPELHPNKRPSWEQLRERIMIYLSGIEDCFILFVISADQVRNLIGKDIELSPGMLITGE